MVSPQGRLFGTNGVRFKPGVDADLEFVLILSECIGTYFSEGDVLVGRDGRLSGEALSLVATSGLMSSGRNVGETGMVPTPGAAIRDKGARIQRRRNGDGFPQPGGVQRDQSDGG